MATPASLMPMLMLMLMLNRLRSERGDNWI